MGHDIKVTLEEIRTENGNLQDAINRFKKYDASYLEDVLSSLDAMHSDYMNALKRVLRNMQDTNAPELAKHAQEYSDAIKNSVDAFDQEDQEIAKEFEQ